MRPSTFISVGYALAALSLLAPRAAATDPASMWSVDRQSRTHHCVQMREAVIPLYFPDGTPTGFYAWADDPSDNGSWTDCGLGYMEIDAQEMLTSGDGTRFYFRPGGPFYINQENNGQYGHIKRTDMISPPTPEPQNINGQPIGTSTDPATARSYYITPTRIPDDMYYKPPIQHGSTGSKWWNYANTGYDKTDGRGDWTYLFWSVVQTGTDADFPDNVTRGGGLVRALGRRDRLFHRGDVFPLTGKSYAPNDEINGAVTSVYGRSAGDGGGSWIYAWLIHSHQKAFGPIVPSVRVYQPTTPRIHEAPVQQSAVPGQSVTLSVVAAGVPAPTYRWFKNGTAMTGATSAALTLDNVQTTDDADYHVEVKNGSGTLTTTPVRLAIVNAFQGFVLSHGLNPATDGAPTASPAGDGIANLLKFILDEDPRSALAWQPDCRVEATTTPELVFRYQRRKSIEPAAVAVEHSTDLQNWSTALHGEGGVTFTMQSIDDRLDEVTVRIPLQGSSSRFVRLRVTL